MKSTDDRKNHCLNMKRNVKWWWDHCSARGGCLSATEGCVAGKKEFHLREFWQRRGAYRRLSEFRWPSSACTFNFYLALTFAVVAQSPHHPLARVKIFIRKFRVDLNVSWASCYSHRHFLSSSALVQFCFLSFQLLQSLVGEHSPVRFTITLLSDSEIHDNGSYVTRKC